MPPLYGIHVTDSGKTALYSASKFQTFTDAERAAPDHCEKQTGSKRVSIGTFADACQGVALGPNKTVYKALGKTPREAWRGTMAACMRDHPVNQFSMRHIPPCSGFLYASMPVPITSSTRRGPPDQGADHRRSGGGAARRKVACRARQCAQRWPSTSALPFCQRTSIAGSPGLPGANSS